MPHLIKLKPEILPKGFDIKQQGEKPIVEFDFKDNVIEISYAFPGFTISHKPRKADTKHEPSSFVHEVGMSGTGFFSENGKPLLPAFGRFVQIPPGYDFDVVCKKGAPREFENVMIKPAQENALDQQAWKFDFDEAAYRDDKFYPDKVMDYKGPLYMDAYRVLCIYVRPMQYNPSRHLLRCYGNVSVCITLLPPKSAAGKGARPRKIDTWVFLDRSKSLEGYGNFIFNPCRTYFDRKVKMPAIAVAEKKPEKADFLILYGKVFEQPARQLAAWKTKRGLETKTVSIDTVFKAGEDKAVKIRKLKKYIRSLRRAPFSNLRYALLFGDVDEIPTEQINRTTTDHYFFTHRNSVNKSECILPWISGGRIPARSKPEGASVVDQIIRYEKNPPEDPKYYERMTVAAYFEDCGEEGQQDGRADKAFLKTMESIREHLISQDYDVNRVYVKNYDKPAFYSDGSPVPEDVKKAMISKKQGQKATQKLIRYINKGQLLIGHRGHGEKWGWDNPPLKNDDLQQVTSQVPSIFFSINCLTGSFDWRKDCFAEHILALNGGAPSLIASTEFSGTWRNDSMIKALYDAIWPGVLHTFPASTIKYPIKYGRMGDLLNYSRAYLLVAHGFNQNTRKHFEIYHVIGDPTLQIWAHKPIALELRTYLAKDVLLINMNTCPRDSVLSVWYKGERLIRLKPSVTRVAIPLMRFKDLFKGALRSTGNKNRSLSVCLAAPGHRIAESIVRF